MINKTFWRFGYQQDNCYKTFYVVLIKNIYGFTIANRKQGENFVKAMDGNRQAILNNLFDKIDNEK